MIWKFTPIAKRKIWGGDTLLSLYPALAPVHISDDDDPEHGVGEVWLLSGVDSEQSVVAEGSDKGKSIGNLIEQYGASLLGVVNHHRYGTTFPLLIKYIDAAHDLSVQVHPDDAMARSLGLEWGKSEFWYVVGATMDARLAAGFKSPQDPEVFKSMANSDAICENLRYATVDKGDVFYIPAGRIHMLGAGCKVLEIQQTSDITYRLYDYHRKDTDGNERELHTELGYRALNFDDTMGHSVSYDAESENALLIHTPHFTARRLSISSPITVRYDNVDTFKILIALSGSAVVTEHYASNSAATTAESKASAGEAVTLHAGECLLVSADSDATIRPVITPGSSTPFTLIETYIL